ncbi:carbamoyl-phosphate synthase large subunit [Limnochorda pilosa]|uniref:Carbamoyl phosphate synthase large chain n=1 Tax=Limnochorda pilosa TaxID=1555112 RepID=A0A0K2SJ24_LIMPI|nr:carbamoyl-phosphate synthase large subunit [Limnochorda pilosa]BAS27103.1 carbamoyl phosphate synthase large subunit [Limnochorda pilosa]
MPKDPSVRRVLVIGSGPIVIGQAAEFDYAGTQACRSLREEGVEVVLVNSNPATIMTDPDMADRIYFQPLTLPYLERIIARERPDGLLPTLGGQTGLNLAVELARAGVLDRYGVRLLGTPLATIEKAEDRQLFKNAMEAIGEPVIESRTVGSVAEGLAFAAEAGYPVIIRPAFTLGGTGGGMVRDERAAREVLARGLKRSPIGQVLVERSVAGWKEIEYEVMRDKADTCIAVCNMENLDPIGVHTGDSAVIAPSQTLSDREYQMLRSASLRIIRALGVEGGCNIQFALSPTSLDYYVIEVNPRVSRSSALASKATGYPIARVAAKIAVGLTLPEIANAVTGKTTACFEPALDYVVMKLPRWPFDTFGAADRSLGTQMKATGEVMAIGRTYEEALMKAIRSLDQGPDGLLAPGLERLPEAALARRLEQPDDQRLFLLAEALRRGWSVERVSELSKVDRFFLDGMARIVDAYGQAARLAPSARGAEGAPPVAAGELQRLKALGLADSELARLWDVPESSVRELRRRLGVRPVYKIVDTCAAEFEASTPYYYSTYDQEDESRPGDRPAVLVLGSGPIRIGQGIEFDYACVHSAWALQEAGYRAVMVNSNPETVSTDFDTSDALYFEPLTLEDVLRVVEVERPAGVVAQFGGQTAINLAAPLHEAGVPILGTSPEAIDVCEDRERFADLCRRLGIPQPEGVTATSVQEAMGYALKLGFPLLVRPSYVLGGRAMEIVTHEQELFEYLQSAVEVSHRHPVLVDRYLPGREVEVDLIADGEQVLIPGIMEHVERAGVHSGDSSAFFPPRSLSPEQQQELAGIARRLALAVGVRGIFNIQFVLYQDRFYCLEANPRASRTVPFLSKVTGVPMVRLATQVMLGKSLAELGYAGGLLPAPRTAGGPGGYTAVKSPVFSFEKMQAVETSLGPEMKSTGEVMGLDRDPERALAKALAACGMGLPAPLPQGGRGRALLSIADRDKPEIVPLARRLAELGFELCATPGTAAVLREAGLEVDVVPRTGEGHLDPLERVRAGEVRLVVNTPTQARQPLRWGFQLRRLAVEFGVPCFTSLDTLAAALRAAGNGGPVEVEPLDFYVEAAQAARRRGGARRGRAVTEPPGTRAASRWIPLVRPAAGQALDG